MEGAIKLARQYFLERQPQTPRLNFIARRGSWHGCTLGTLSLGDLKARKEPFIDILHDNVTHVSPCHPYRDLLKGETPDKYVARLAQELEDEFQRLGPSTVCAFVVETMVGTVCYIHSRLDVDVVINERYIGSRVRHRYPWILASHEGRLPPSWGSHCVRRGHVWPWTYRRDARMAI